VAAANENIGVMSARSRMIACGSLRAMPHAPCGRRGSGHQCGKTLAFL